MNSSENSSEETDQLEDVDSSGGTRRSYECTFCRRGFTNAQALGGHMNIHRKDRAKAKHTSTPNNSSSLSNRLSNNNEGSFASASPLSSSGQQSSRFYSIFEVQGNYNTYFQPSSATNPRNPSSAAAASYAFPFEYLNPRSHHRHRPADVNHQELLGANLNLQIGPSHVETNHHQKEGEVDLELRLGHHPY